MTSSLSNNSFSSLEELYNAIEKNTSQKEEAELLLFLRGWYLKSVEFDGRTGEALSNDLENFLLKVGNGNYKKDYISRIIDHSEDAIKHIFQNPREKILREHAIIPIYAAREVDSTSVQWLSRQSGRNLREKLAEKPYIKAVQRRFSHDTTENKLFKAFIQRVERYLFEKEDTNLLNSKDEELLQFMERWLHNDMTKEIGSWSNFPPNNTLLQDKYYRKIWDSWLWIQGLDELVEQDNRDVNKNFLTLLFWSLVSELNRFYEIRLIQQPIYFDYDSFKVKSSQKIQGLFYSKNIKDELECTYKQNKVRITLGHKILFMCEVNNNQLKVILHGKTKEYSYSIKSIGKLKEDFLKSFSHDNKFSKQKLVKNKLIKSNTIVIDLDLIYPKFITEEGIEESVKTRFVTQYWKNEEDDFINIDCAKAKAILLKPDILTVSMRNIFLLKDLNKKIELTSILNDFTRKVAKEIDTKELVYLVSDRVDEFSSEKLRKSFNYAFSEATPLPRSVAATFYLHNNKGFNRLKFNENDLFVVIEVTAESVSATKLIAKKDVKLKKILPTSEGITWERHPSVDIEGISPQKSLDKSLTNTAFKKDIVEIWGKDGLEKESTKLSWASSSNEWFTYDRNYTFKTIDINWKEVQSKLGINKKANFEIIIIGEYANQVRVLEQKSINVQNNLLEGANSLDKWQEQVDDIPLWRDHLPELSFNIPQDGAYKDFYLVKNTTIIPKRGMVTNIVIDKPLTLPKDKEFYEFPLTLGNGNSELEFMASLRSSIFPLSKNILCHLRMTYTYGADDPYVLYFEPQRDEDKEFFNSIKVEWKELSEREQIVAPIPDFPKRYNWKDFEKNYNKEKNDYSNLFHWIEKDIQKIIGLDNFMSSESTYKIKKRSFVDIANAQWKQAGNGDYFCRFILPNNKKIFIHQQEYQKFNIDYKMISFDIKETRGDLTAINISEGKSISNSFDFTNRLRKSIRFPLITVWNQGHSLSEDDVPDSFRKVMYQGIRSIVSLLENKELNKHIKKELQYILSLTHRDIPNYFSNYLLTQSQNGNIKQDVVTKMVAYAIGDASCDWQKELLANALKSTKIVTVLSIALWRSESLVNSLSKEQLDLVILEILKSDIEINKATPKLEVLLALLRTRKNKNSKIQSIFAINSPTNKKFIQMVEKLTSDIIEKNISIKTRITFNLNKPKALNKTHDLLYALRLYLTGEDGANSIEVTEVESE